MYYPDQKFYSVRGRRKQSVSLIVLVLGWIALGTFVWLLLTHLPELLWNLSTPLTKYLP